MDKRLAEVHNIIIIYRVDKSQIMRRIEVYSTHYLRRIRGYSTQMVSSLDKRCFYMKKYIHESDKWLDMKCDERSLRDLLTAFYQAHGRLFGKLDVLGFNVQNELQLSAVSDEIVTSSEIEGEILNRSSVRSSVAQRLGLECAGYLNVSAGHYIEGVIDIALDATQNFSVPITDDRLFGWHCALFPGGKSGLRHITVGAYRVSGMSIISGAAGNERVHYEAPGPERVSKEMKRFLEWLENEKSINPYVKAGIAHFWFEAIHPFDDGNGRIGRAISDYLLSKAENNSKRYYSLSSQILKERQVYYNELEFAESYNGDLDRWIHWFLGCLTRAIEASEEKLEISKQKAVIFDNIRHIAMNERQLSMLNKLIEGFEGKLTTAKWAKINKCSHDTALRDIEDLINKGILTRSPEGGRSTSYKLTVAGFS